MKLVKSFVILSLLSTSSVNAESNKVTLEPLLNLSAEMEKPAVKEAVVKKIIEITSPVIVKEKKIIVKKKLAWGYSGKGKPEFWGELSAEYSLCKTGKNQSPVNFIDSKSAGTNYLDNFDVFYRDASLRIKNTGHRIQVDYPLGSYVMINQRRYELLWFHFHTSSEHKINGFNYPMELQLVHKDTDGNLAIIAIVFQEGERNQTLQKIINKAPTKKTKQKLFSDIKINPNLLFPLEKKFYKYNGSLTTPPCTEGIYWMVFKQPVFASPSQIKKMHDIMGDNNRPVQKNYARTILKSWQNQQVNKELYGF